MKENLENYVKKDCFGYCNGECNVLVKLVCKEQKCSFYKTWEQERKDRDKYGYNIGRF